MRTRVALVAIVAFAAACDSAAPSTDTRPPAQRTVETVPATVVQDGSYRWQTLPVGGGGFVTGIVVAPGSPSTYYARTDVGGAYRWSSTDAAWQQILNASNMPDVEAGGALSVDSIAVAPSRPERVYVAIGNDSNPGGTEELSTTGRILVSDDGGATWATSATRWFISGNQRYRVGSERLAVDPEDPDHVLFGSSRQGLWQSLDGGDQWLRVADEQVPAGQFPDTAVDQVGVGAVAFADGAMFAGVNGSGIYMSIDGGVGWQSIRSLDAGQYAAGAVAADGGMWVGLHRSDGGAAEVAVYDVDTAEWADIALPFSSYFVAFAVDPADPERVVVADEAVRDQHFWTSTDGGRRWRRHDVAIISPDVPWLSQTDLDGFMSTGRLQFDPSDGTLWFAEGMGVWRTTNLAAATITWEAAAQGIEETVASAIVVPPGAAPLGAVADRQGFRFDDWTRYPVAPLIDDRFAGGTSIDFSGGSPNVVAWVGAEYHIYYSPDRRPRGALSTDGGATWQEFGGMTPEMFGGEIAISATDPATLVWLPTHLVDPWEFSRAPVGLYVSHDSGLTWAHQADVGGTDAFHRFLWWFNRRALAADRVNGNFYLMSDDSRFFVSTDGADTWTQAAFSPTCHEGNACHVLGQVQAQPDTAERLWAGTGIEGLWRTDDAGRTPWQRIDGIDEVRAFGFGAPMAAGGPPAVYLYGRATGDTQRALYRSDDDGVTWTMISVYPADRYAEITAVSGDPDEPGRVYVAFSGQGFATGVPTEESD